MLVSLLICYLFFIFRTWLVVMVRTCNRFSDFMNFSLSDYEPGSKLSLASVYLSYSIPTYQILSINLFVHCLGNVMSHHKTIKDLEQYYARTMGDDKDVKNFLENITSDKEG